MTPDELRATYDKRFAAAIEPLCWQKSSKGYARFSSSEGGRERWMSMHRLVWVLAYGKASLPQYILHINGNRLDNRLANLRPITPSLRALQSRRTRAVQQCAGVTPNRRSSINPFQAGITYRDQRIHLGVFPTMQAASAAYEAARAKVIAYEASVADGKQSCFPDLVATPRRRGRPRAELDLQRAIGLYAAGASLAAVGQALGVDGSTVRRRLLAAGVTMRGRTAERRREANAADRAAAKH